MFPYCTRSRRCSTSNVNVISRLSPRLIFGYFDGWVIFGKSRHQVVRIVINKKFAIPQS